MDLDSIEPGLDFAEIIEQAVSSCAVLVAVIGRQWATAADEQGDRRLDNPDDFVRFEVQAALQRRIRVIPVLVDGAKPLRQQDLPAELHKLARLNAHTLSYTRYKDDTDQLVDLIQRVLAAVSEREEAEQKAREETEQRAREEADHQAQDEADRHARQEAERKVREEADRRAQEEAERKAREEAERNVRPKTLFHSEEAISRGYWAHLHCHLTVTTAEIRFVDTGNGKRAFTIPASQMQGASVSLTKVTDEVMVELANGRKYKVGFDSESDLRSAKSAIEKLIT